MFYGYLQIFGCPHAWPHHDAYPVSEPMCAADADCKKGELCCQLFNNNYCLMAVDATPRPGMYLVYTGISRHIMTSLC